MDDSSSGDDSNNVQPICIGGSDMRSNTPLNVSFAVKSMLRITTLTIGFGLLLQTLSTANDAPNRTFGELRVAKSKAIVFGPVHATDQESGDRGNANGTSLAKGQPSTKLANKDEKSSNKSSEDPVTERLGELFKPLAAVNFGPRPSDTKAPEDKAAERMSRPELYIGAAGHPRTGPNRYTICSCHNPLYFEELNLERCGNSCGCLTPVISAAHFLSNTLTLPYQIGQDLPCSTQCAAGDCGCCQQMPCLRPFQCSLRGVALQGAAVAGFVFLLL